MVNETQQKSQTGEEDSHFLDRAVSGDLDAFSLLYERYIGRIYNYVYYRVGSAHDAEDLTARVFYKAFGHINTYRNMGLPFSAWLYRIAHNLVANWHRDKSRRKEVPLEDYATIHNPANQPESSLIATQENEALLLAIQKMPEERQHLLVLKYVEGLSNAEIALIMGRSEGAIKGLYHRTLLSLRDELQKIENQ
jgi:RNA polymerase sigma-70 factor, ECF subfamily